MKESFARGDLPSKGSVRKLLQDIFYAESAKLRVGDTLERKAYQQSREFDIRVSLECQLGGHFTKVSVAHHD